MNRTKDGQAIAYEGQLYNYSTGSVSGTPTSGNPTHYPTSTGQYDLEWADGRKLMQIENAVRYVSFTYGQDGLRTSKTVKYTATHNYYYAGGKLLRETYGSNTLDFAYDAEGKPYSLTYNGTKYYYITNVQGDVMYLVNSSGTKVASYTYSPYGEVLTAAGSMAEINPLRYRGYYFDSETGLYYLQSRYYNPVAGRWINADSQISGVGGEVLGYNTFAYCFNNPVNMSDPTGNWPKLSTVLTVVAVVAVAVVAVAAVAVNVSTGGAATPVLAVLGEGVIEGISAWGAATAASVATEAAIVGSVSTVAAVTSAVAEKSYERKMMPNNTVYRLVDNKNQTQYVGRTTNIKARAEAHRRNPYRKHLRLEIIATGLNYYEARGLEQIAMLECHTINTANRMNNQINGISPSNSLLGIYMEAGRGVAGYLGNQISNEILYWTGN